MSLTLRYVLTAIGAMAGATGWLLLDWLNGRTESDIAVMSAAAGAFAFFATVMALSGQLALRRLWVPGVLIGVALGAMIAWGASRHDTFEHYSALGYGPMAFAMGLVVGIPHLGAYLLGKFRDYPTLFDLTWTTLVRALAALAFTGVFWGVVALSSVMLEIVHIDVIEWLLDIDPVPFVLTGAMFGLAMAIVHELRDYISPRLVLRLLRLLSPIVLAVSVVFLAALPFTGLSGLVGNLSPAATLMAMSIALLTLITVSLDRDTQAAAIGPRFAMVLKAMAVVAPILAALSLYALWIRTSTYGLTPPRMMALTVSVLLLVYGGLYARAVMSTTKWQTKIRQGNIAISLVLVAVSLLWISPLLSPERISAGAQLNRLAQTQEPDRETLYAMAQEWGSAGKAALQKLAQTNPTLAADISEAKATTSRWRFIAGETPARNAERAKDLVAAMTILTPTRDIQAHHLLAMENYFLSRLHTDCVVNKPTYPCVLLDGQGPQKDVALVFAPKSDTKIRLKSLKWKNDKLKSGIPGIVFGHANSGTLPNHVLKDLNSGAFTFQPKTIDVLKIGEIEIFSHN